MWTRTSSIAGKVAKAAADWARACGEEASDDGLVVLVVLVSLPPPLAVLGLPLIGKSIVLLIVQRPVASPVRAEVGRASLTLTLFPGVDSIALVDPFGVNVDRLRQSVRICGVLSAADVALDLAERSVLVDFHVAGLLVATKGAVKAHGKLRAHLLGRGLCRAFPLAPAGARGRTGTTQGDQQSAHRALPRGVWRRLAIVHPTLSFIPRPLCMVVFRGATASTVVVMGAEELRQQGNDSFQKGDFHKAIDYFSKSLFAQQNHKTYNNRSIAYLKLGQPEKALADADLGLNLQPTGKGFYRKASALIALQQNLKAIRACDDGLKVQPGDKSLHELRDKAEAAFHESQKRGRPQGLGADARAHAPRSMSDRSPPSYEEGRGGEDDDGDSGESDGEADSDDDDADASGEDEETMAEQEAAEAERRSHLFRPSRAPASSYPGATDGAAPPTGDPAADAPSDDTASTATECREKGNASYKAGDYAKALEWYSEGVSRSAQDEEKALILCNRSAALLMMGNAEEAAADAQKAASLHPDNSKAWARAGKCLLQLGALAEARRALSAAAAMPASHPAAPTLCPSLPRPSSSSPAADRANELRQGDPAVQRDIHSAEVAGKLMEEVTAHIAAEDYTQALQGLRVLAKDYCPHSDDVQFKEMDVLVSLGRHEEVLGRATQLLRTKPDSNEALYLRGRCLFHAGQLDSALKHTTEALRLEPDDKRSKGLRAQIKALLGAKEEGNAAFKERNFDTAVERYSQALAMCSPKDVLVATLRVNRATALFRLKRFKEAIDDCSAALDLDSKSLKALLRRASCYMELEEYVTAIADYELALRQATDKETEKQVRWRPSPRVEGVGITGTDLCRAAGSAPRRSVVSSARLNWRSSRLSARISMACSSSRRPPRPWKSRRPTARWPSNTTRTSSRAAPRRKGRTRRPNSRSSPTPTMSSPTRRRSSAMTLGRTWRRRWMAAAILGTPTWTPRCLTCSRASWGGEAVAVTNITTANAAGGGTPTRTRQGTNSR